MLKRSIILLSFVAYALTLVHSIVPHHHHDRPTSEHHHDHESKDHHAHDDHEQKTISHAFADAIHFPGSDLVIYSQQSEAVQKIFPVATGYFNEVRLLLSTQLKPPDRNIDQRSASYLSVSHSLFLLRAPPVA
jgi:hypothetical protein